MREPKQFDGLGWLHIALLVAAFVGIAVWAR